MSRTDLTNRDSLIRNTPPSVRAKSRRLAATGPPVATTAAPAQIVPHVDDHAAPAATGFLHTPAPRAACIAVVTREPPAWRIVERGFEAITEPLATLDDLPDRLKRVRNHCLPDDIIGPSLSEFAPPCSGQPSGSPLGLLVGLSRSAPARLARRLAENTADQLRSADRFPTRLCAALAQTATASRSHLAAPDGRRWHIGVRMRSQFACTALNLHRPNLPAFLTNAQRPASRTLSSSFLRAASIPLMLLLAFAAETTATEWPMLSLNAQHSSFAQGDFDVLPVPCWAPFAAPSGSRHLGFSGPPSTFGDNAYFVSNTNGWLYCVSLSTGTLLWSQPTTLSGLSTGVSYSQPAISGGVVIVGAQSDRNSVLAYDASSGTLLWEHPVSYTVWSSPCIVGNRVFVNAGGRVYCLDLAGNGDGTTTQIWSTETDGPLQEDVSYNWSSCAVANDRVVVGYGSNDYAIGTENGGLVCLSQETGEVIWDIDSWSLIGGAVGDSPVILNGYIYFVEAAQTSTWSNIRRVSLFYESDSDMTLLEEGGLVAGDPATNGSYLFFRRTSWTGFDVDLVAISTDGTPQWIYDRPWAQIVTDPIVVGNTVVFYCSDSSLVALDSNTGNLQWERQVDGRASKASYAHGHILFTTSEAVSLLEGRTLLYCLNQPLSAPTAPLLLTAVGDNQSIALTWSSVPGATGYRVFYDEDANNPPFDPENIANEGHPADALSATSLTLTNLPNDQEFFLAVAAYNMQGESDYSNQLRATPTELSTFTINAMSDTHGTVAPSGNGFVAIGGDQAFVAYPNSGYEVDEWQQDASVVQTGGNSYTIYNVQANHTLLVTFKPPDCPAGHSRAVWTQMMSEPTTSDPMAYDSLRGVTVRLSRGETWEWWNGSTWVRRAVTGASPSGLSWQSVMAYDSARGVTVLMAGGYGGCSSETWEWDGNAWSLRSTSGPSPRRYPAMAYDSARGVTVLFGGETDSGYNGETWEWDGISWTLRSTSGPSPRRDSVMAYDDVRGLTVLHGGRDGVSNTRSVRETWEWDGASWTLRSSDGPYAFLGPAMAYDSARGVTVFYGMIFSLSDPHGLGETWEWDGATWTQRVIERPSSADYGHSMSYDSARGVTVLYGGRGDYNLPSTETFEYDGDVWVKKASGFQPAARLGHTLAYDSDRGVTVLFGGRIDDQTLSADTWEWNGTRWERRVVSGPSARCCHAMSYDSARGVTVLFGGDTGSGSDGETWEWDGISWTLRSTSGPSPRRDSAMAYDSGRGVTVLFGGYSSGYSGQTWEWDGTDWTWRSSSGPSPRIRHSMAYDSIRGYTVMFGGHRGYTCGSYETWEWDGTNWLLRNTNGALPNDGSGMAYDASRGVTILLGMYRNDSVGPGECVSDYGPVQTWEWDGVAWALSSTRSGSLHEFFSHVLAYDSRRQRTVFLGERGATWEYGEDCVECLADGDCDDGLFCNGIETCDSNGNCQPGVAPCPCQLCDEANDVCVECLVDGDCDDGLFCNGIETCDGFGNCQAGVSPCTDPDFPYCDEANDVCVECLVDGDCDDGLFCNGIETCDGFGNCQAGVSPCTDPDFPYCDEANDVCVRCDPRYPLVAWYRDVDGDGFGNADDSVQDCNQPSGYVLDNTDCDDTDANRNPGASDVCEEDRNCDGLAPQLQTWYRDADGDGFGNPDDRIQECAQPTGYVLDRGDCDDADVEVNPGAREPCDGIDHNCDGQAGQPQRWYPDADGDGYGAASGYLVACVEPLGYVADNSDCDDGDRDINPGGTDLCGVDLNCDGQVVDAAPVITNCPMTLMIALDANCQFTPPDLSSIVEVSDDCTAAEDLAFTSNPADLSLLVLGDNQVIVKVTDESGNSTSCAVTVTIEAGDCRNPNPNPGPDCGDGLCATGVGGALPFTILGMWCMKVQVRRRRRR